jgi:hypothetical protein
VHPSYEKVGYNAFLESNKASIMKNKKKQQQCIIRVKGDDIFFD